MFTGIIEAAVPTRSLSRAGTGARLLLPAPELEDWRVQRGQSIAVAGCCLTVSELIEGGSSAGSVQAPVPDGTPGAEMLFDLSAETLQRTWFGRLEPGQPVNLERALKLGDRLDGHMVSGHVDGQGVITAIEDSGDGGQLFTFGVGPELSPYLVEKGSVTLDGISLTVVTPRPADDSGTLFDVAIIPLTLEITNLGQASVGDRVNVEVDMVARWIERLVRRA